MEEKHKGNYLHFKESLLCINSYVIKIRGTNAEMENLSQDSDIVKCDAIRNKSQVYIKFLIKPIK
jgi:hypothetical protein